MPIPDHIAVRASVASSLGDRERPWSVTLARFVPSGHRGPIGAHRSCREWEYGSRVGGLTSLEHAVSHPYQLLLRVPSAKPALLSVLLSAVPLGTITLGLLLSVQAWTGSLALAGSITSLFTLGNAIGLAIQGALIDRFDERIVVPVAGLISGSALVLLGTIGDTARPELLAGLSLIAGVTVPAITTAVRRLLPRLVEDEATRSAGYAVLSVMFQLAFAVGPLLVSLALMITGQSAPALLLAAVMIVVASAVFGWAAPHRAPTPMDDKTTSPLDRSGWRPLIVLYGVAALAGAATGVMTVAVPAVMQAEGLAALAGLAFAASAIGDVGGALVFGGRRWPLTQQRQLATALVAASGVGFLVFSSSESPWLLVVMIGIGGAIGAPVAIRKSSLLDVLARPESLGMAYAVLVSVGLVAAALGTGIAGQLGTVVEPHQLLLGSPLLLLLAAALSLALHAESPHRPG